MHFFNKRNQLFEIICLFAICTVSYGSYGIPPSTGSGLPYSIETKTLVKTLFDNRTIVGGQVIALKDQPGKSYSGNYIDVGSLAGVNVGDVFAFFTPRGEPVGFGRIVEVQRYTSSFSFIELTVDPTDNLIGKKVTQEIKLRLSPGMSIDLPMDHFKKSRILAIHKKRKPVKPTNAITEQNTSSVSNAESTPAQSGLPSLPSDNTTSSALPPLPGDNTTAISTSSPVAASDNGSGLPALPSDNSVVPGASSIPASGELPPLNTSNDNLPGLPGTGLNSSSGVIPPSTDSTSAALSNTPPSDNSSALPSLPSDSSSAMFPSITGNNSASGDTSTTLPPLTMSDSSTNSPSLPSMDNGGGLLPANNGTLPGVDSGTGLPVPGVTSSLPNVSDNTMASVSGNNLQGLDNGGGLPAVNNATLPAMDNSGGLPASSATSSLPNMSDNTMASTSGNNLPGLSGMDNGGGLPPASNGTLPGMDNGTGLVAPSMTTGLSGMSETTVAATSGTGLPSTENVGSTVPGGTLGLPNMPDTTTASNGLPGMNNVAMPAANSTLPGMDNGGLPPAVGTGNLPGLTDTTVASTTGTGLPGMSNGGELLQVNSAALPPGIDNGGALPSVANNSLPIIAPDNSISSSIPAAPGELPSVDSTVPAGFPPTTMGSLPLASDVNTNQMSPPDISATAPPIMANLSSSPVQSSPVSSNYHPSDLDIPAMPSKVNTGYLQDIPTLSSSKKPAA